MSGGDLIIVRHRDEDHRVFGTSAVIGRSQTCDVSFDRPGVSRQHCEIIVTTGGIIVRDLGSSHGTWIDGKRILGEAPAFVGSIVRMSTRGPTLEIIQALRDGEALGEAPTKEIGADDGPAKTKPHDRPRGVPITKPATRPGERGSAQSAPAQSARHTEPPRSNERFLAGVLTGALIGALAGLVLLLFVGL